MNEVAGTTGEKCLVERRLTAALPSSGADNPFGLPFSLEISVPDNLVCDLDGNGSADVSTSESFAHVRTAAIDGTAAISGAEGESRDIKQRNGITRLRL